ncbi:MAG: hypothetical protein RMK89_13720 [Armatimonadota bacterium]|nr:hypothetical protein [Armatimonadota bacterium]MDW8144504.1 hypothetical protein [Armatimonadota bacterium]
MNERLVQWTLLREWSYLQSCLRFPLLRRYGENIRTEHGILDFAVLTEDPKHPLLVVELETSIDSRSKLRFIGEQLKRYKQVVFHSLPSMLVLLYADDATPTWLVQEVRKQCHNLNVIPRTYSLQKVQLLYQEMLTELTKAVGIPLGPTCAMDVCYLRWMNSLIKPFVELGENELPVSLFFDPHNGNGVFKSRTTYSVRKRLCEDFELVEETPKQTLILTKYGERFAEAMIPDILSGYSQTPTLSLEQKRILLEVLTNGVIRPCKANIYYFLRFVYLTEGAWVPKPTAPEPCSESEPSFGYWQLAAALFGKRYAWRTLTDFLSFTCNQCEELGLVERIKLEGTHNRVVLTPIGSRILDLMEIDLHLKRERIHIPMQVTE